VTQTISFSAFQQRFRKKPPGYIPGQRFQDKDSREKPTGYFQAIRGCGNSKESPDRKRTTHQSGKDRRKRALPTDLENGLLVAP